MTAQRKAPSLRREIVLWYSIVLLVALGIFTGLTFLLMRQALEWSERSTLRRSAEAVERFVVPPHIPRLETHEDLVRVWPADEEVVRRRTVLATGDTLEIWFAPHGNIEVHALRAFLIIALLLVPLTAVMAAVGGRILLERLLEPLQRLVETTRGIGIRHLSRRVEEPDRPAELQDLARSFNGMLTRLDEAVLALTRFTADASHELRTPLTSIKGTIQVALTRPREAAELEETLGEVLEEAEWMLHLVDGLLTLARGDEETARTQGVPVDLTALLGDVTEVGAALARGKPLSVRMDAPPGLTVIGLPGQLRQIFLNLVSNAVKFTEQGSVTLTAREAGDGWVEVRVADTGVGIAPEELPRVFDRFYRGEAARARPGGTGLGLAIAKLLVERHGGAIEADSTPGRGSEFVVRLAQRGSGMVPTAG